MMVAATGLLLILLLAYREASRWLWMTAVAAWLGLAAATGSWPSPVLAAMAVVAVTAAAVLGAGWLRRRCLSGPLLQRFRTVLPRLSQTERQAIEAGSVGWDGELFSGRPDWNRLLRTPAARLTTEEQAFLDGPVETLCRMLDDWQINQHRRDLPEAIWDLIRAGGFLGLILPRAYGGLEFSSTAHSAVVEKLATRSLTAAVTVMVPNALGPGKLLLHYGTPAQKARYLPRLARGDEIPCFALTGPHAGSDAGAIPDTGVVCRGRWNGEDVLGLRLNWNKRYITLAPVATLIGLAVRCVDPERLLGGPEERGITLVLVPRDTTGVEVGARHWPMGIAFMNGPTRGRDVFLPLTQVIGGPDGIGQGWRMLMEALAEGRGISLPALATGATKKASRFTGAYARLRRQFDRPIGDFEGVEEALARIAGLTYQMDAARQLTLAALDRGERPAVVSAIVKYHLTESYRQVVNDAMDIEGGRGICIGPSNLLAGAFQAIPIAITVEGANILTRSLIIFGQGAIRCHPWVLQEYRAAHDPDHGRGLRDFDRALLGHLRHLLRNAAASLLLGLTRGWLAPAPRGAMRRHYRALSWMSAVLAVSADAALMTLGGTLKRHERLSARLGDVLSELYLASAVLKRFHDDGEPAADAPLVDWAVERSLYRVQESLRALYRNLPSRPLAWLLRTVAFPAGMRFTPPGDRCDRAAARILLNPSAARDRLTAGIFIDPDPDSPDGRIERALREAAELEPLERHLAALRRHRGWPRVGLAALAKRAEAQGLITAEDRERLESLERLVDALVQVDAFDGLAAAVPGRVVPPVAAAPPHPPAGGAARVAAGGRA